MDQENLYPVEKILLRRSKRGVPHTVVTYKGRDFSVCYFGKGKFYRIFEWAGYDNTKLLDVPLSEGGSFNLGFVLDGLSQKTEWKEI